MRRREDELNEEQLDLLEEFGTDCCETCNYFNRKPALSRYHDGAIFCDLDTTLIRDKPKKKRKVRDEFEYE